MHYLDKYAANNQHPSGYMKNETRKPTKSRIYLSRLADRSIRSAIKVVGGYQVVIRLLSYAKHEDVAKMVIALAGDLCFQQGLIDRPLYPYTYRKDGGTLVIACYGDRVSTVEGSLNFMSKEKLKDAFSEAITGSMRFCEENGFDPRAVQSLEYVPNPGQTVSSSELLEIVRLMRRLFVLRDRGAKIGVNRLLDTLSVKYPNQNPDKLVASVFRLFYERYGRIDGRKDDQHRAIKLHQRPIETPLYSVMVERGNTRVLSTSVVSEDPQSVDDFYEAFTKEHLNVQYDMLGHAVSSTARLGAHNRREVGHSRLVYNGVKNDSLLRSNLSAFIQNDVLSCDGSSSLASLIGTSVCLVKTKQAEQLVTGVTVGRVNQDTLFVDISGVEDWLGLMDFKLGGNPNGVTVLQADFKTILPGETEVRRIIDLAWEQNLDLHASVSGQVAEWPEVSYDERVHKLSLSFEESEVKFIIGYAGYNVKQVTARYPGVKIDIDKQRNNLIATGEDRSEVEAVIEAITSTIAEPEDGKQYEAVILKAMDNRPDSYLVQPTGCRSGFVTGKGLKVNMPVSVQLERKSRDSYYYKLIG